VFILMKRFVFIWVFIVAISTVNSLWSSMVDSMSNYLQEKQCLLLANSC